METPDSTGSGGRITTAVRERLRNEAAGAEQLGRLTDGQLAIIQQAGWFKLFVPESLGGLGMDLPQAVRLEEALAGIDGSLGWTVTLCAGANWFVGFFDTAVRETVFADPAVCLGGSGQASGQAERRASGYRVNGSWRYATGAPHLTHFTANAVVTGSGETRSFLLTAADVAVLSDWNTFGLKATASHSFVVSNRIVDEAWTFRILPEEARLDDPVYRYPFLQLAETTLAANTLGMGRHFLFCAADSGAPETVVRMAATAVDEVGVAFYDALDQSWAELLTVGEIRPEILERVSSCSRRLVADVHRQVLQVFPYTGMVGADASAEINRVWRDLFTASQHALFRQA